MLVGLVLLDCIAASVFGQACFSICPFSAFRSLWLNADGTGFSLVLITLHVSMSRASASAGMLFWLAGRTVSLTDVGGLLDPANTNAAGLQRP